MVALNAALQGIPVAYVSLEMSKNLILDRWFKHLCAGVGGWRSFQGKADFLKDLPIGLYSPRKFDPAGAAFYYEKTKARFGGCELLVIDHLGLMSPFSHSKGRTRDQELGEATRYLKMFANNNPVAILLLSQLNRVGETQKPQLLNLRDSGNIEQDADTVTFLYRDEDKDNIRHVYLAKNRSGGLCELSLKFEASSMSFSESWGEPRPSMTTPAPVSALKTEAQG